MAAAFSTALLPHCHIVETGSDSWRFKSCDDDHATSAGSREPNALIVVAPYWRSPG